MREFRTKKDGKFGATFVRNSKLSLHGTRMHIHLKVKPYMAGDIRRAMRQPDGDVLLDIAKQIVAQEVVSEYWLSQ